MAPRKYYDPVPRGLELQIREKLARQAEQVRHHENPSADTKRTDEEKNEK
jgi:hypothetical protein